MSRSPDNVISVIRPLRPAMTRTRDILFRPVDFSKWIAIAFCSFLAGRTGSLNFNSFYHRRTLTPYYDFMQAREYIEHHLPVVIPTAIAIIMIFLAFMVGFLWLSSRGQFMFLHCVVFNRGEVSVPWKKYAREAGSLWKLRMVLSFLRIANFLLLAGVMCWSILIFMHQDYHFRLPDLVSLLPAWGSFFLTSLVLAIVSGLTGHFVVPIMLLRKGTSSEGWKELGNLISERPGKFLLYLIFQFVFVLAIFLLLVIAVLCTCCVGALLLIIPFVSTVVLLPVTVFTRSYQLHYLAQYGKKFDVFASLTPPPVPLSQRPPLPSPDSD